jgi:hypothetical protein
MDEMTALREFRDAVRGPDEGRLASARAALLDAAAGTGVPPALRRAWPRPHARPVAVVLAATAIALVLLAVNLIVGRGGSVMPANAAMRVLLRAADAELSQPAPRGNQFIYTKAVIAGFIPAQSSPHHLRWVRVTADEQMWQSVSGSRVGAISFTNCHAGVLNRPVCQPLIRIPAGAGHHAVNTYAGLSRLPQSPSALLGFLAKHAGCPVLGDAFSRGNRASRADVIWDAIANILGDNMVVPPRLGHALFLAAARLPGVVLLRHVTDAAGRRGIAVARTPGGALRTELIFAPGSYRFIGVNEVLVRPAFGLRAGTVFAASALLGARVTDTAPKAPGPAGYVPSWCGTFIPTMYSVGIGSSGTPTPSKSATVAPPSPPSP